MGASPRDKKEEIFPSGITEGDLFYSSFFLKPTGYNLTFDDDDAEQCCKLKMELLHLNFKMVNNSCMATKP